jgi:hypothetical protein
MPVSSSKNNAKYAFSPFFIDHEANMQRKESRVVRKTIGMDKPSTPIKYSTLKEGIHERCSTNWKPLLELSNLISNITEIRRERNVKKADVHRIAPILCLGRSNTIPIPISGRNTIHDRM